MHFDLVPWPLLLGLVLSLAGSALLGLLVARAFTSPDETSRRTRPLVVTTAVLVMTSFAIRAVYFAVSV